MCQIIRLDREDLFQTSTAMQNEVSVNVSIPTFFSLFCKGFLCIYNHQNTALVVLSVNNRYTGSVRADISYGKIMGRKNF